MSFDLYDRLCILVASHGLERMSVGSLVDVLPFGHQREIAVMKPKLTADQITRARQLLAAGVNYKTIGQRLGCCGTTVHRALDPDFNRQIQEQRHQPGAIAKFTAQTEVIIAERRTFAADALARLAEIPADVRGLTARLMGDPIPGDRRRGRA